MNWASPSWKKHVIEVSLHRIDHFSEIEDIAHILQEETSRFLRARASRPESSQDEYTFVPYGDIKDAICQRIYHQPNVPVQTGSTCYETSARNGRVRRITCESDILVKPGEPAVLTTYQGENLISQICVTGNVAAYRHWFLQKEVLISGTVTVPAGGDNAAEIAKLKCRLAAAKARLQRRCDSYININHLYNTTPSLGECAAAEQALIFKREDWHRAMCRVSTIERQLSMLQ